MRTKGRYLIYTGMATIDTAAARRTIRWWRFDNLHSGTAVVSTAVAGRCGRTAVEQICDWKTVRVVQSIFFILRIRYHDSGGRRGNIISAPTRGRDHHCPNGARRGEGSRDRRGSCDSCRRRSSGHRKRGGRCNYSSTAATDVAVVVCARCDVRGCDGDGICCHDDGRTRGGACWQYGTRMSPSACSSPTTPVVDTVEKIHASLKYFPSDHWRAYFVQRRTFRIQIADAFPSPLPRGKFERCRAFVRFRTDRPLMLLYDKTQETCISALRCQMDMRLPLMYPMSCSRVFFNDGSFQVLSQKCRRGAFPYKLLYFFRIPPTFDHLSQLNASFMARHAYSRFVFLRTKELSTFQAILCVCVSE